jgi:RecG-like helicase
VRSSDRTERPEERTAGGDHAEPDRPAGIIPIGRARWRKQATVEGRVTTVRVDPTAGSWLLECVIDDGTGALSLVFNGRKQIGGLVLGAHVRAQGTVASHRGRLAIFNPVYSLLVARR